MKCRLHSNSGVGLEQREASTRLIICASAVLLPTLMACMCMTPFTLRVPSITESPILFAAGEDSPVIMLLLTGLAPHTAMPSAGTFAAGGTFSKSPL
ncbi:unnamed protein product [Sphagnum jensenii]|uniref:Uncharacterized protein n=1 Tax=Sphagnum jensenii TaxID=128206 RepID=A0ABP0X7J2_9BRYO